MIAPSTIPPAGWKGNNNEADGFSAAGTEGNWYSVTVINDRVTQLELSDNFLLGTLPPGPDLWGNTGGVCADGTGR